MTKNVEKEPKNEQEKALEALMMTVGFVSHNIQNLTSTRPDLDDRGFRMLVLGTFMNTIATQCFGVAWETIIDEMTDQKRRNTNTTH